MDKIWSILAFVCLACLLYISRILYVKKNTKEGYVDQLTHASHVKTARNSLSVLAFGDSLTAGFCDHGRRFFPYTLNLRKILEKNFPHVEIEITNEGISGDLAKNMLQRLEMALLRKHMDIVIILAGTNDYGHLITGNEHVVRGYPRGLTREAHFDTEKFSLAKKEANIYNHIVKLHEACHKKIIKTVAVTIPQLFFEQDEFYKPYVEHREEINKKLEKFAEENKKQTLFLDLANKISYFGITAKERERLWSDGVHFTRVGYDHFGLLLFKTIEEFLRNYLEKNTVAV